MGESSSTEPGRIFLSYRRQETAYPAAWLYGHLASRFGRDQVFKDVDSIKLGDDFAEVIAAAVGSCDVLLALIGDQWLAITDDDGKRRLDDPNDFVRLEIEAALQRKVRVIPILVEGARMPRPDELPTSLASMARRQALELSAIRFELDVGRLLSVVDETVTEEKARREAEEKARREAEEKARREAEEKARREAEEKAKAQQEAGKRQLPRELREAVASPIREVRHGGIARLPD